MNHRDKRYVRALLFAAALQGCAEQAEHGQDVGVARAALSVCDETVPPERFIDGIPAYAQCDAVSAGPVYSDDGVNTSTTSLVPEWVRTQWSGGYQCTELAKRYLHFVWGIDWTPRGNAGTWCDETPPANSGMVQTTTPVHGDLMVLAPGSCGAGATTGHVNVVDVVEGSGRLFAIEQNRAGRGRYQTSCARCFLHVIANDGAGGAAGDGAGGAAGDMAGTGGAAGAMAGAGGAAGAMAGAGAAAGAGAGAIAGAGGADAMNAMAGSGAAGMNGPQAGEWAPVAMQPIDVMPVMPEPNAMTPAPFDEQPIASRRSQEAEAGCTVSRLGALTDSSPLLMLTTLALWGLRTRSRSRKLLRQRVFGARGN